MDKYRFLMRNTIILSIGTGLAKIVVFCMMRFYTGILTPAEYGNGDLIITTASLFVPFVSFGIAEGVFRFLPEYPQEPKSILSSGFYMLTCGCVLFLLLLPFLWAVEAFRDFLPLLWLLTMCSGYHTVCGQYVRASGDTILFALQGLLNTLLVVVLNIIFLAVLRLGITGYVLSVVIADFCCTLFLIAKCRLFSKLTLHPDKVILRRMLKYSIPLIPTTAFWWITSVSDRYMIVAFLGNEANGIYTVANKLPTLLTLLAGILMQAWQYSAVCESKSGREEQIRFYTNVWQALFSVMFCAAGIMAAGSKLEIMLLADEPYFDAWRYVPLLCAAMLFCTFTSFFGSVYTVTEKSGISFWTSLLGAAVNILLNLMLIPSSLGIYGAAIATFFSYFLVFLVRARSARRWIPFRLFKRLVFLNTLLLAIQIAFINFELPGSQWVQGAALLLLLLLNCKQLYTIFRISVRILFRKKGKKGA